MAPGKKLVQIINEIFDMRPKAIIDRLGLLQPIYSPTAAYGHFGREAVGNTFPWEKLDFLDQLKKAL